MKFDTGKTVAYWVEGAEYDLRTAEGLLGLENFPYALFFGHLAIEKILKALIVKETGVHAPHTHALLFLAGKSNIEISEDTRMKLAGFMEFHIEARYPDEKREFYKKCTKEFTERQFQEIRSVFEWLRRKL